MRKYLLGGAAALAMLLPAVASAGNDYRLEIVNDTDHAMTAVQVAHVAGGEWGENLLDDPIGPGDSRIIWVSGNQNWCRFNIYAQLRGNRYARRDDLNICEASRWTVTEDD